MSRDVRTDETSDGCHDGTPLSDGYGELKPAGDEASQERKPFSGWKVKIEYEATDSDGQPYRSEYWFIMDKDAQCVIRSFEIPLL